LTERIVEQKNLISTLFKEYLFASVFQSQNESTPTNMMELAKQRSQQKKSSETGSSSKSREVAYQLLNELIRKSPLIMHNFIRDQLEPLMALIKRPSVWNY